MIWLPAPFAKNTLYLRDTSIGSPIWNITHMKIIVEGLIEGVGVGFENKSTQPMKEARMGEGPGGY